MRILSLILVVGLLLIGSAAFAADGDLIVNGNIGVGTTSPATNLEVNGGIKAGNVTTACTSALNGVMRWTGSAYQYCNGTSWMPLGGPTTQNDVTGSRSCATDYHNTTGKAMYVSVTFYSQSSNPYVQLYSDSASSPTSKIAAVQTRAGDEGLVNAVVLPNNWYRVICGGSGFTMERWVETY